ncbi:hypothetical protein [Thiocystis minor]|uniref:hypothetical protein n=1 Tax=Thiocystis minor TaxID=61597 RepID=UPI001911B3E6|nr:hypothetical protein [Thiocystis minor]
MNLDHSHYNLIFEHYGTHGPEKIAIHLSSELQVTVTAKDVTKIASDLRKKTQRKIDLLEKDGKVDQAETLRERLALAIPPKRRPVNKAMESAVEGFMASPMPSDPAPVEEEHGTP